MPGFVTQQANYTPSSTNLFVRYLPREVDDNRLREIFSAYGTVTSSMVMRDIHTGQSMGNAFVRFATHEEAVRAFQEAHGMPLFGKTLAMQWAKQQHDGTPAGQERLKMNKLFLRNVPLDVTADHLVEVVRDCGEVVKVTLHNDTAPLNDPARTRRIAFIIFEEYGAAEAALRKLHNSFPFRSCDGIPLMGKLSEDYRQKERTPRTPSSGLPPRTPHTPHNNPNGTASSNNNSSFPSSSPYYGYPGSARSGTCSNSVTPRAELPNSLSTSQTIIETPRVIDTPRSVGMASGRTNQTPRTLSVVEVHSVPSTPHKATAMEAEYSAAPLRTREKNAAPTTITAPSGGVTVTIRNRPSACS
jgi:RNA recognition motif-containing protein